MVKGSPNIRSFFHAKESPTKPMHSTSPGRPPLSALSASARNNLSAGISSPAPSASKSQSRFERYSPQGKNRGVSSGHFSYPSLENVDSNVGSSCSNSSSPERYSTPCGTPLKSNSRRSSGTVRLPFSSTDLENAQGYNSPGGAYEERRTRKASNTRLRAKSSEDENTTIDDSDPSSTSGSEVEDVSLPSPSPARRLSAVRLSRQSSGRQEGLRRMSLGPKIEAAVSKLEKTPSKPSRPGLNGTPSASPVSLRASARRALVLQEPNQAQTHFDLEENPTFWDDHNVQVVIRTRPTSGKEASMPDFSRCLRQDGPHAITWLGQPETRFTFDHVAGENVSQEKLFKVVGIPIVENCMAGYNSCMFAYGQTGSGKTHTMLGDITNLGDQANENCGMTPRIFEYLFSKIQKEVQDRQLEQLRFVCKCSFLEIYNEQITDLLEPSSSNLQMREDSKKGVFVENLTEMVVSSVQDVISLLQKGAANRKVASTNMNRESSRSHSVFTCIIESKWMTNCKGNMRYGRLNLVDLAGSERQKSSGAEGDRLKEASSINKSLSTLGLVIMTLVDMANGKPRHVPYRDSKLTFLLQDSLGGNSKTAIIATISPSSCCSMETLSTLKFAQRAKFIQNNAVINEDASEEVLALRREIQELKHGCWDDIVEQEEVNRLRSQTLSSMQRECRRASNEFFRMSITGRDLFDAAEKQRSDETLDLKSVELLGKVKALEAVLAGALRREQVAEYKAKQQSAEVEKANKLIEDRELELINCKGLLHLIDGESARHQLSEDVKSSDSEQRVILAEKQEIANSLERNSAVSKLQLENYRLTEQIQRYRSFFDSGERVTMAAEIQGLREQTLELLDGKIAVERDLLSTTIAQGDSYRKELETCRNDLTNCLEASTQLQRQVGELQTLVNQLTEKNSEKERELKQMKESAETYANVAKLKEEEIKSLRSGWQTATANLYRDLVEGERALVDAGKEMADIVGEDWLPKVAMDIPARWSIGSVKSLTEVDIEHDYFKGRDSCNSDDIFGDRKTSRRKKSFGVPPRLSVMEDKMKLQASVARLEQELEVHKQRVYKEERIQEELDRVVTENLRLMEEIGALAKISRNIAEIVEENEDLKVEVKHLRIKFLEQSDAIGVSRDQISALDKNLTDLEKIKLDQEEALALKSQELLDIQEKNLKLLNETSVLSLELKDLRVKSEETNSALDEMVRTNDKLIEESVLLKLQAEKDQVLQSNLNSKVTDLEVLLKRQQEEMSELETEIERLELLLHEAECHQLQLENSLQRAMKNDQETITVLEEAKEKLDTEARMLSSKLESTDSVQEELRVTLSFLHDELEKKTKRIEELDLQAKLTADADAQERNLSCAGLINYQSRIDELETSLTENKGILVTLEEALLSATATCEALKMERDAARARADLAQGDATSSSTQSQELREKLDLSETLERTVLENDFLKEELAAIQALVLENQSTIAIKQQKIESNVQAITLLNGRLNETVEQLQMQLQRKEDCFQSLEFDLTLLQESEAEDTDFKKELLKANAMIRELQDAAYARCEELRELVSAKNEMDDQLLERERQAALATTESLTLNSRISQLQTSLKALEGILAEKNEAVTTLEKELVATRVSICMESSCKTESSMSLHSESQNVLARRDDLKALQNQIVVDKLRSEIKTLRSLNKRLEEDLILKIEDVASLGTEVMAARNLTAQSLEQVEEMRDRICVLEEKHRDMQIDIALENSGVGPVAAELSAVNAASCSTARDLDDLYQKVAALISAKENLENSILQKDEAMSSMDADLMAVKGSLFSLESFRSKLAELQIQRGNDEAELQMARENQAKLQNEIHNLARRLADSEESNNTLKLELAENITAVSTLQDRISIASRSFNYNHEEIKAMKAEIGSLMKERDALQAEVGHKLAIISSLENELAGARAAAGSSRDRVAALETKVVILQVERDSMDKQITDLEADVISTLQIELTEAQKSLKSLDNEMAEARRVSDCFSDENSALQARIVALEAERGSLQAEILSKTARIMSLETELTAASLSSAALRDELKELEVKFLELQNVKAALETEVGEIRTSMISLRESELFSAFPIMNFRVHEDDEMRVETDTREGKCSAVEAQMADANQEMDNMKAQIAQQELQLSSLEELLAQKAEALQHVVSKAVHATHECEKLKSEVEGLRETLRIKDTIIIEQENALKSLEVCKPFVGIESDEIRTIKDGRDQALVEVQALHGELRAAQVLVASHKSSVLEAQKFAEVNILRASGKEEEARTLRASVSALKNQNSALEKQLEDTKRELDILRKARDEFEMELQGMKNRMTMLQAVHSTGSRNFKGFQAAQAASLDLQKTLEDKETEVSQMYKRMTVLHSQNEVQASRLEEMETELAHVHQELDDLQTQCEDKDAQLRELNGQLKEAETLTQDVMRDLHNVKLDISNYASLVSQQQLELISERARHSDEAREKDEELSNLQTQLNQERQNWMVEMNHKQAEIVVARVLSEKMRLKNKTLSAEYKRLKADYGGKRKKLKILEQQLTQLTSDTRRFSIGTESEADFDEVKQFQALLAQANDHERAQKCNT